MSVILARDVAYVRFRAPDLAQMRDFLRDFGMIDAHEFGRGSLFMRGYGTSPFVHATDFGTQGFAALGLLAPDLRALDALARTEGSVVEALDAPGGGAIVRLTDPDGFVVEVVAGQSAAAPLASPPGTGWNEAGAVGRTSAKRRSAPGPSHVLRLGHVVLGVSNFRNSERWYKDRFGLLTSDEIQRETGVGEAAFLRCDRGSEPCDHHTLFLVQRPAPPGFMHAAFEVAGLDDLMVGHEYLKARSRRHYWGVGRHVYGSQVFDYWLDPWGNEIEHWTDGDQLTAEDASGIGTPEILMSVQWGMTMPPLPE